MEIIKNQDINEMLLANLENTVTNYVGGIMSDPVWQEQFENRLLRLITDTVSQKMLRRVANLDLDAMLTRCIDQGIERWQERLRDQLRMQGITDRAAQCELAVVDGAVVVSNIMVTPDLLVENNVDVKGRAQIADLSVTNSINFGATALESFMDHAVGGTIDRLGKDFQERLVQAVLESARESGIDFSQVKIGNELLVRDNCLSSHITETSITSLGTLEALSVRGKSQLSETLFIQDGRVGVNTPAPDAALSIWDEEVCLSMGKHSKNSAFVGTSRTQNLVLGVNRRADLTIDDNGLTTIKNLRIDRWRISHSDTVPGWSGTKGDLVINSSPSERAPFGWSCLGAFRWQEIRLAQ